MHRKISVKGREDKYRTVEFAPFSNQYYMPQQPMNRLPKTPKKNDPSIEGQRKQKIERNGKSARKLIRNNLLRSYSLTFKKNDFITANKNICLQSSAKLHHSKKIQGFKIRSESADDTSKKYIYRGNLKNSQGQGRSQLKIDVPTAITSNNLHLKEEHFNNYYNNCIVNNESKTIKAGRKYIQSQSGQEFNLIFTRCKSLIEDYQKKLLAVKKENLCLIEQNRRLRHDREMAFKKQ